MYNFDNAVGFNLAPHAALLNPLSSPTGWLEMVSKKLFVLCHRNVI